MSTSVPLFEPTPSSMHMRPELARTLTLDTWHKTKIENHRRTTLVARRLTLCRNLPRRIDKVWACFAAHAKPDTDTDTSSSSISFGEFNLVLNDHAIAVSPDMSAALIWLLLDHNHLLSTSELTLGLASDNDHNDPMRERSFHAAQFKRITKSRISKSMLASLMTALETLVCAHDKSQHPKHLSYKRRNLVIWDSLCRHLHDEQPLNVEEDYLYGALSQVV